MSSSNCCFLICTQISQEAGQVVWYSHPFKKFPQFVVIHNKVKGFGVIKKAEVDVFLELSCFLDDPADVGNLIFGSSAFSKSSLNIWPSRACWPSPCISFPRFLSPCPWRQPLWSGKWQRILPFTTPMSFCCVLPFRDPWMGYHLIMKQNGAFIFTEEKAKWKSHFGKLLSSSDKVKHVYTFTLRSFIS